MKNHELLDMIGEASEDYIEAADSKVARPRFRWKALAACAACAALAVGAYSVWQMAQPIDGLVDEVVIPLHGYTVMEGGALTTQEDMKAPAGSVSPEATVAPGGAYVAGNGGDTGGEDIDGTHYSVTGDVPVDEAAANQYSGLLQGLGGQNGGEPDAYPEWFAGSWIDHGGAPDAPARLAVAIVDSFHTPELENQVRDWCGGTEEILFTSAKYSYNYLDSLMDPAVDALDGTGLCSGVGVDVTANCLGLDIYSDGTVPDHVLAELARLDPDGDAIRVRVFANTFNTYEDEAADKGLAPNGARPVDDADGEPTATPIDASGFPAEVGTAPEENQPAQYDILPGIVEDLPEKKCGEYDVPGADGGLTDYDLLGGADGLPGYGLLY